MHHKVHHTEYLLDIFVKTECKVVTTLDFLKKILDPVLSVLMKNSNLLICKSSLAAPPCPALT